MDTNIRWVKPECIKEDHLKHPLPRKLAAILIVIQMMLVVGIFLPFLQRWQPYRVHTWEIFSITVIQGQKVDEFKMWLFV